MGEDKALLPWPTRDGEQPLFVRAARVLEEVSAFVEISVGNGDPRPGIEQRDWTTFRDEFDHAGPLAGLSAALDRARSHDLDGVLALACDMPLVDAEDLRTLLTELQNGADAAIWTVPRQGGSPQDQPLVGAYSVVCAAAARDALASGARRMVAIEALPVAGGRPLRLVRVPASENSSHRLVNVNTPSDYDSALVEASSARALDRTPARVQGVDAGGTSPETGHHS
ncbi:molybdopterin-guanine dinucleotide biosynthesis protein MobA [Planctomycetes bacterium Poly30]|uniref:Molybdopterin-guanine dinucleotide biosynthesis protein MobA n=2 Tax=Saltatorellus ferox TaxID=2528018 RepID=A0A518ESU0_9BACT|nr:molybdopterin-guanine dinucleotide biosynthesis protein MobA [Planctomycetes bacterium Poly30]